MCPIWILPERVVLWAWKFVCRLIQTHHFFKFYFNKNIFWIPQKFRGKLFLGLAQLSKIFYQLFSSFLTTFMYISLKFVVIGVLWPNISRKTLTIFYCTKKAKQTHVNNLIPNMTCMTVTRISCPVFLICLASFSFSKCMS